MPIPYSPVLHDLSKGQNMTVNKESATSNNYLNLYYFNPNLDKLAKQEYAGGQ